MKNMKHNFYHMTLPMGILCSSLVFSSCSLPDHKNFSQYTDQLFQEEIAANTLTMHYTLKNPQNYGISEYSISLGDLSKSSRKSYSSQLKSMQKQLKKFKKTNLDVEEAMTLDVLCDYVDTQLALSEYQIYEEPLLPSGGIASQLPLLMAEYSFTTTQDVNDYLAILEKFEPYYDQVLEFEEEKAEKGLFMSDELCQDTISCLETFIENPQENYLLSTFERKIKQMDISEEQKTLFIEKNQTLILDQIIPSYEKLISGMTGLMGSGKNDLGLYYLEDGRDYYSQLVYADTGCSDSMEKINERIETARTEDFAICANIITANPEVLVECSSFEWNFSDDEQMLNTLCEKMLTEFPTPPEVNYEVCNVDSSLEDFLAPAFYITSPIDDYINNTIYINSASSYQDIYYFTTLAHEGFPGHLYQTVMSYEYGIEPIRSILDYPGYTEGWATYVEMISYSYAGLSLDVAQLLMHNQAATLSLYASSDIGIHYYGWNREQMRSFWSEFGVEDEEVIDEITRLILADPGNYLKYYVGYLEFMDLREQMQTKYQESFSEKSFHEALLRMGPAPFDILEKYMDDFYSPQTSSTND